MVTAQCFKISGTESCKETRQNNRAIESAIAGFRVGDALLWRTAIKRAGTRSSFSALPHLAGDRSQRAYCRLRV